MADSKQNILSLRAVTIRYGRQLALDSVSCDMPCGSMTAILGANGAGKSSLLRAIVGLAPLAGGEILIGDHHPEHARPRFGYLPQRHAVDWDFPITVRGVVEQGCYAALRFPGWLSAGDAGRVDRAMAELDLTGVADRQIRRLSGGQQQRVFLARALAQGADIFLLDEPFAGLDLFAAEELTHVLRAWESQGRTVLVALHDLDLARRVFSRAVMLATTLVADGPIGDVLTEANIERTFRKPQCVHGA